MVRVTRRAALRAAATAGVVAGCGVIFNHALGPQDDGAAYLAWQGPPAEADRRLRLIGWARLAPSSHNLQPWRIRLEADPAQFTLFADPARLHTATDPYLRQTTISQGTFLEILVLAARSNGLRADITPFPDGFYETPQDMLTKPVATIRLTESPGLLPPPLIATLRDRRTTRLPFTQRAVPRDKVLALGRALSDGGSEGGGTVPVTLGWIDRGVDFERLRALITEAMRAEMNDSAALSELSGEMRLDRAEVATHRDGIVPQPMLLMTIIKGLLGRDLFTRPGSWVNRVAEKVMAQWTETAAGFLWLTTPGNDRRAQLAAGRAYARLDLAAANLGLAIQPLSQPLQEYPAVIAVRNDIHGLLAPNGGQIQMLARLGWVDEAAPHAPRRAVREFLIDA